MEQRKAKLEVMSRGAVAKVCTELLLKKLGIQDDQAFSVLNRPSTSSSTGGQCFCSPTQYTEIDSQLQNNVISITTNIILSIRGQEKPKAICNWPM